MDCLEAFSRSPSTPAGSSANGNKTQQKPACDRCKGQKLRCIWPEELDSCLRCTRANAVCKLPPSRPIGRPRRSTGGVTTMALPRTTLTKAKPKNKRTSQTVFKEGDDDRSMTANEEYNPMSAFLNCNSDMPWTLPLPSPADSTSPSPGQYCFTQGQIGQTDQFASPATTSAASPHGLMHQGALDATQHVASAPGIAAAPAGPSSYFRANFDFDLSVGFDDDVEPNYSHWMKQLGDLNVALHQHHMHERPPPRLSRHATGPTFSDINSNPPGVYVYSPLRINVASLHIGRLLSMSVQLRNLTKCIVAPESQTSRCGDVNKCHESLFQLPPIDRSAVFLALSCYIRLELIFVQTLETLRDIRNHDSLSNDNYQLLPELSVDGYALGCFKTVQLHFVIQLCEQALRMVQSHIKIIQGAVDIGGV
ncbi:hypothetical protein QQS21_004626 [Conoideocrella luteorostrata]|uniref:Zn(2)-C6 fungal-type domain-containing protein n=1 Tax=Conoideocrella luteorostrata TaxID=1105319 RepID=A0AAJ0FUI7_9HYPO|nr:hypothetical protein QQS21_004626 [Conoideocrella luteorostrata]